METLPVPVRLERRGACAVLTLDRPQTMNALSFNILHEIGSCLDQVASSDARALVITGAGGKAFCAGADIKELTDRSLVEQRAGAQFGQKVFAKLDRLPVASIALVDGYAFGGGAELALACTFRLFTNRAKFGLPEIKLGLIPGYGGTQRLSRLVGLSRAVEIVLTGRTVLAEEAFSIGLANRLAESLDDAVSFAREFSGYGLVAQRLAREAMHRGADLSLSEGLQLEADLSTLAYRTHDAEEGMRAFLQKRTAVFEDR